VVTHSAPAGQRQTFVFRRGSGRPTSRVSLRGRHTNETIWRRYMRTSSVLFRARAPNFILAPPPRRLKFNSIGFVRVPRLNGQAASANDELLLQLNVKHGSAHYCVPHRTTIKITSENKQSSGRLCQFKRLERGGEPLMRLNTDSKIAISARLKKPKRG